MTLLAAEELRAHIDWAIGKILDTQDTYVQYPS
jgi:hypothetical protein